jgi:hypothetical protein
MACGEEACDSGELSCSGAELWQCNQDRTDWELLDTCDTPSLCNATSGECGEPACEVDELSCNGDTVERCNGTRTAFEVDTECGEEMFALVYEGDNNMAFPANATDGDVETASIRQGFSGGFAVDYSMGGFRLVNRVRIYEDNAQSDIDSFRVRRRDGNGWTTVLDWEDTDAAGWHDFSFDPVIVDDIRFEFMGSEVYEIEVYGDSAHCNSEAPSCGPCEGGSFACYGDEIFVCDPDGRKYTSAGA